MNGRRSALRSLAAVAVASLLGMSGAAAQSGNPIKVGMTLALTGAGAPAGKAGSAGGGGAMADALRRAGFGAGNARN